MNEKIQPPKWANRMLGWFCTPDLLEEAEGDLYERFQKNVDRYGEKTARRKYIKGVFGFMRR